MRAKEILKSKKTQAFFILVFLFLVVFFVFGDPDLAMAQDDESDGGGLNVKNKLIIIFGWLIHLIVNVLGKLLIFVIGWLTQVASWDKFVNVDAVVHGWTIIRDLCNMFFVLILLVIAFATILRVESYNVKKLLPKVIIMAVLINFSKTICGVAVELSQIVMLTFVNAFAGSGANNSGANNLVNLLGIDHMYQMIKNVDDSGGELGINTVGGLIVAFIAALIAFVVVCAMLAVLLFRLIMIWVYIVISPLAFLLYAFPHGKGYASRWASSFSKQLIVGPVLAFFLWLALYTAKTSSEALTLDAINSAGMSEGMMSRILEGPIFQTYIITIAFLLGGLVIAQEIGEVSGKAAGKGLAAIQKGKAWTGKQARRPADWGAQKSWQAAKGTAKGTGRIGLAAAGAMDRLAGRSVTGKRDGEWSQSMRKKGLVATTVGGGMRLPASKINKVKESFRSKEAYRRTQKMALDNTDKNGVYRHKDDNDYKVNDEGYYQQVDKEGNWQTDEKGNPQYLKDDEGQAVKKMSKSLAAFHDSWTDVQSGARATSNKAQDERVEAERKKMEEANMDENDLISAMNDVSASRDKRMAAAMQAAIKKGFRDKKQIDQAKKLVSTNDILSDKMGKEVDKNQAHLAYDFTKKADREKFKQKIGDGDIDSTKLNSKAYKDKDLVSTLKEHHGDEWGRIVESIYKRGDKKTQENFAEGLKGARDEHYDEETGEKTEDWSKMAKIHAKLTGKIDESFMDNKGEFDTEAFKEYTKNKPADLNKIKVDNLENAIEETEKKKGADEAKKLEEAITKSFGYGKLKSMHRQGDNPELVRTLRDMTKEMGRKRDKKYIEGDHELNLA